MNFLKRLQMLAVLRLKDNIRYSRTLRHLNALRLYAQSRISSDKRAAVHACRALGFSELSGLDRHLSHSLRPWIDMPPEDGFWEDVIRASHPRYDAPLHREPGLTRSILLKAPSQDGEKGVLLIAFEYNAARLVLGLSKKEFSWLDARYDMVLSTSWSPTDYAVLAAMLARTCGPVFVEPSNFSEEAKLGAFHQRIKIVRCMACDWINPGFYSKASSCERTIDFLMIANWGEFKRHWDFFQALKKMPTDLRVVLIGQREGGRDAEFIRDHARALGVLQKLEIHQSLSIGEVSLLQEQAKVSVIFSRREGSCVSIVESMFAGCAVGMLKNAHVGSLEYVNEATGMRLRPEHLPEDLMCLHKAAGRLTPANWARSHISCFHSHEILNSTLRDSSVARDLPWRHDLAVHHWRPYPAYTQHKDAEALFPACRELNERFPSVFGKEFMAQAKRMV